MNDREKQGCVHPEDAWENYWCGDCGDYVNNCGCRGPKGEVMHYKEKQIEEMAHKLCKSKKPCVECIKRSRDNGIFVNKKDCDCYSHAKILSKYYQPKIPEDSIVMSKKEWKQIKNTLYYSKETLEKKSDQARKVAIKEFAEKLKVQFEDSLVIFYPTSTIEKKIKAITKEFGVEL